MFKPGQTTMTDVNLTGRYAVTPEWGDGHNLGIFSFRIDADYKDPLAAKAVRPFVVVYRWKEDGAEKTDRKTVDKLPFTYGINTAAVPEMVSVSYEMSAK